MKIKRLLYQQSDHKKHNGLIKPATGIWRCGKLYILFLLIILCVIGITGCISQDESTNSNTQSINTELSAESILTSTKWYESGIGVGPGLATSVLEFNSNGNGKAELAIGDGGSFEVEFTYSFSSDGKILLEQIGEFDENSVIPDEWKELSISLSSEEYNEEYLDVITVTLTDGKQIKFYSRYIED